MHPNHPQIPDLTALFEAVPWCVWLVTDGGQVLWANHPLEPAADPPAGQPLAECLGPESAVRILRRVARVLDGGEPQHCSVVTADADALQRTLNATIARYDGWESPVALLTLTDVTGSVRTRSTLVDAVTRNQEIERQDASKRHDESVANLAGGLAHDFNNLLGSVLANVYYARDELQEHNSELIDPLDDAIEGVERAASLCKQLMAYAGRAKVRLAQIDLGTLVREMESAIRTSIGPDLAIRFEISSPAPTVRGDAQQLQQAVIALVDNAAQAMRSGGEITIRVDERVRGLEADGALPTPLIEVSDTGIGMSAEQLEKAAQPFFTTQRNRRGLGLALVQGVLRGHRGTLELTSEEGRGCQARMWFSTEADWVDDLEASGTDARTDPATVLVVDDDIEIRALCGRVLARSGHRCRFAADGPSALEQFRQHSEEIALVLLDLSMARLDGHETWFLLRQIDPDVPVVLLAGRDQQTRDLDIPDAPETLRFLHKPFPPQALAEEVQRVVSPPPAKPPRSDATVDNSGHTQRTNATKPGVDTVKL